MKNQRITFVLATVLGLALAACGGGATDTKDGKAKTAKADAKKADAKKADAKKADAKKLDAKKPEPEVAPTTAAPDEPPPDEPPAEGELTDEKVVEVARMAKEIAAKPADTDAILQSHGMDRTQLDTAIAAIAGDPWKSDLYIAAFAADAQG